MNSTYKAELLQKRRWRIRKKVVGTAMRPRLSVKFSGQNIYAQAINDELGLTLVFLGTLDGSKSLAPILPGPQHLPPHLLRRLRQLA